ncbi:hypothetical protein C2857_004978 [Epichloe festucae Fl1]|uniref:GH64 domain-containing protein n=1 Tax=Epichloe festucae (strain Fl1) TaxID=877507 RepID=A0A7S9KKU0_EPIFF|nr:hypothetical protein C2857_004978 [Epichloe festucae Fl1]
MRSVVVLAALLLAVSAAPSSSFRNDKVGFTYARAGGVSDIVITKDNTLNGTYPYNEPKTLNMFVSSPAAARPMPLEFINNFSGGQVKAYIQGIDSEGKIVFIKSDGSLFYPIPNGSDIPVEIDNSKIAITLPERGQKFNISLPIPIYSGRVYFSEGKLGFYMVKDEYGVGLVQPSVTNPADPSSETNWGFVELTYSPDGTIFANISYVDYIGMILSMSLSNKDSSSVQLTKGLDSGAVSSICKDLVSQSGKDGRNWKAMCVTDKAGKPIRVLSPNIYAVMKADDFEDYWQEYVDQVWQQYSNRSLTIDTQGPAGKVKCRVNGSQMNCDGDNRSHTKPSAKDIWSCDSGPFGKKDGDNDVHLAVIPRLCAAFVRSTLLLQGGDVQPSLPEADYYKVNTTNHYSRLVHEHEVDGQGYAFAFDDVNPDGENASGTVASRNPDTLRVCFGAPLS